MNIISNTDHHEVKAAQVGFIMKAYRESFPTEAGRRGIRPDSPATKNERLGTEHSPMTNGITSHATVSRWESGKALPTPERLRIFGKALDLSDAEIEGLILLASPDPQLRECRTLSCPRCGGETKRRILARSKVPLGGKTETTSAIRTRQCSACGYSAESCERWSEDPGGDHKEDNSEHPGSCPEGLRPTEADLARGRESPTRHPDWTEDEGRRVVFQRRQQEHQLRPFQGQP